MNCYHKGVKLMTADPSWKLNKNQIFNRNPVKFKECKRSSLAHNLRLIFEGFTNAYCTYEKKME